MSAFAETPERNPLAIEVQSLGKQYILGASRRMQIHEVIERAALRWLGYTVPPVGEAFWAVQDCSFSIRTGEVVGILGHNGAGKSVLLKMLAQVAKPSTGSAVLRGRVVSLLELGAGFDPEMTGRENIYFNGAILGVRRNDMAGRVEDIIAFSGIERFIDEPTKTYSSGMYARLAFAVAAHVDADVLLIDEVLAVGDVAFRKQCLARLESAAARGATILFVSHSVELVSQLCHRCLVLRHGQLIFDGDPSTAVETYQRGEGDTQPDASVQSEALVNA